MFQNFKTWCSALSFNYQLINKRRYQHNIIAGRQRKNVGLRYWNYGFASVFDLKGFNVVGYISKYMTKDIDDRLYDHRRYLYSNNLKTYRRVFKLIHQRYIYKLF